MWLMLFSSVVRRDHIGQIVRGDRTSGRWSGDWVTLTVLCLPAVAAAAVATVAGWRYMQGLL